ncbi:hypothetical protein QMU90_003357 [Edwardsiella ictaluri]|uniref:Uncharacterized protein n=2 Tax=Edwardsiella ictaluri TaxID=67780 RepID=A0ABY8GEZ4_EDWIC|nr:hypothetical protein [Edwardsiella ictaluri]ELV7529413.1 hypothetical protein [Edwardsiella ictaluri]KOO56111.1 hypothetical protein ACS33_02480 [Edwardsiella ictaluri]QPW26579.1 hypothetical protein F8538_06910 [Edwardsiella ictaluri]WFN95974.1 hypothetical protein MAY91_14250 [Edwardsiella ictaluri]
MARTHVLAVSDLHVLMLWFYRARESNEYSGYEHRLILSAIDIIEREINSFTSERDALAEGNALFDEIKYTARAIEAIKKIMPEVIYRRAMQAVRNGKRKEKVSQESSSYACMSCKLTKDAILYLRTAAKRTGRTYSDIVIDCLSACYKLDERN